MKESYIEGVAIHDDPESCAGSRKAGREVLTGGTHRFGIEPRNQVIQGADAVKRSGRQHTSEASSQVSVWPCAVADPIHVWNLLAREPGDPIDVCCRWCFRPPWKG